MEKRRGLLSIAFAAFALGMAASPRVSTAVRFTATGASGAGEPMNAQADFTSITSNSLTLVLTNTAGPGQLDAISSVLDGIKFTFDTAPTSITLDSVSPLGELDCTAGTSTCSSIGTGSSPYHWQLFTDGSGPDGSSLLMPLLLAADSGVSFKPHGIVNSNLEGDKDGIKNPLHNPYLLGPVTYIFTLDGLSEDPSITGATFYFGTVPDSAVGAVVPVVPESSTLFLLGTGLVALGLVRRWVNTARN